MKKINSIWFGTKMVKWISIFSILIPLLLFIIGNIFSCISLLLIPIYSAVIIGGILLSSLLIILSIELHQDKKINNYYINNCDKKIKLSTGYCECQNCGYTKVKITDESCLICGVRFRDDNSGCNNLIQ